MTSVLVVEDYFQHGDFSTLSLPKDQDAPSIASDLYQVQYNGDLGSDSDESSQASAESLSSHESTYGSASPSSYGSDDAASVWLSSPSASDVSESVCHYQRKISPPVAAQSCLPQRFHRTVPFRPKTQNLPPLSQALREQDATPIAQVQSHQSAVGPCPGNDQYAVRRRGRSIGHALPPPQLRRDTDHTEAIVRMIVLFCTNLINSIWCVKGSVEADAGSAQPSSNVLPLRIFITETLRRSKTSYSTLQIALYYLILLKQCLPPVASASSSGQSGCRAMQCGRRMFLTSLILASKYLQDRNYSARAWSKISGLPLKEINDNERRFLSIVSWDLHVPKTTFENWSKIVLNVCRRSIDPSTGCKDDVDRSNSPPGPGSSPQRSCALSFTCNDMHGLWNWWKVNLQKLRTDIVKCPFRTQNYVESIAPFRDGSYLPRPVFEKTLEDEYTSRFLDSSVTAGEEQSRPHSLDRSTKRFEPVSDLLHPAPSLSMPPQPMLSNLPTPQATPQTHITSWWTPKAGGLPSKPELSCRASASALGNAFRRHCPMANLETCPPPKPRSFDQQTSACTQGASRLSASTYVGDASSLTSSPESITSDVSFFGPRSRSSSISSTSSFDTYSSGSFNLQEGIRKHELDTMARQLIMLQQRQNLSRSDTTPSTSFLQPEFRPKTAFRVATDSHARSSSKDPAAERDEAVQKLEAAQVLSALQIDTSVMDSGATRSRARPKPSLARTSTQIFKPCYQQDPKQLLKRNRSEFTDMTQCAQNRVPQRWRGESATVALENVATSDANTDTASGPKQVHMPDQHWAAPRRPIQTSNLGKRMAIQTPAPNHRASLAAIDMPWFNL